MSENKIENEITHKLNIKLPETTSITDNIPAMDIVSGSLISGYFCFTNLFLILAHSSKTKVSFLISITTQLSQGRHTVPQDIC